MYTYEVFGLTVNSSFALPELLSIEPVANADIVVRQGKVPMELLYADAAGVLYQVNSTQFRLSVDGVARYLVTEGKEILVDAEPDADDASIRLFLLTSPLAAILHQRGILPLHGSSIETPKGAVIFAGLSGMGKSTLAAAFYRRHYQVLADDISVVDLDANGTPVVLPGYPQIKLWMESLQKLEESSNTLQKVRPQLDKYALPIRDAFRKEALPIYTIYTLNIGKEREILIRSIKGLQKLTLLQPHVYRGHLLENMGKVNMHLPELVRTVRVCSVTRPLQPFMLDELVESIEADFLA